MQQVCLRSDCRVNQEKWLWCNCRWWAQRFRLRNLMTAARRELTSISPLIERYCVVAEESKTSASYEICSPADQKKSRYYTQQHHCSEQHVCKHYCQKAYGLDCSRSHLRKKSVLLILSCDLTECFCLFVIPIIPNGDFL